MELRHDHENEGHYERELGFVELTAAECWLIVATCLASAVFRIWKGEV